VSSTFAVNPVECGIGVHEWFLGLGWWVLGVICVRTGSLWNLWVKEYERVIVNCKVGFEVGLCTVLFNVSYSFNSHTQLLFITSLVV
jgi:hypothetical protein